MLVCGVSSVWAGTTTNESPTELLKQEYQDTDALVNVSCFSGTYYYEVNGASCSVTYSACGPDTFGNVLKVANSIAAFAEKVSKREE